MTPHPRLQELRGGGDPYADCDDHQDPEQLADDIHRTTRSFTHKQLHNEQ